MRPRYEVYKMWRGEEWVWYTYLVLQHLKGNQMCYKSLSFAITLKGYQFEEQYEQKYLLKLKEE